LTCLEAGPTTIKDDEELQEATFQGERWRLELREIRKQETFLLMPRNTFGKYPYSDSHEGIILTCAGLVTI
jgi:hypothetical protein